MKLEDSSQERMQLVYLKRLIVITMALISIFACNVNIHRMLLRAMLPSFLP